MEIKDVTGLGELGSKVIDAVQSATGVLYEPTKLKKIAAAKREIFDENMEKVTEFANNGIMVSIVNGELAFDSAENKEFLQRTQVRMIQQELYKQNNIESVVAMAYDELENDNDVSSEPVDNNWIHRFFESVGGVSSEELQKIWSKILSREIKSPGVVSLRTLDVLKNMSSDEAKLFDKMGQYVIDFEDSKFIFSGERYISDKLSIIEILQLKDIGILSSHDDVKLRLPRLTDEKMNKSLFTDKLGIIIHLDQYEFFSIDIFKLTTVGIELYNALCDKTNEESNLLEMASCLNRDTDVKISAHEISRNELGTIFYDTKDLLED